MRDRIHARVNDRKLRQKLLSESSLNLETAKRILENCYDIHQALEDTLQRTQQIQFSIKEILREIIICLSD